MGIKTNQKWERSLVFVTLIISLLITSCTREEIAPLSEPKTPHTEAGRLIKLGKKMQNPYSLSVMQNAYKELVAEKAFAPSKTTGEAITTTHLYVRFLPSSLDELYLLTDSLNLMLFDHCLTYEIDQDGECYHDPNIPEDQITWQYTTVEANFDFPEVKYEVIEECYIPDDNEHEKNNHLAMLEERALCNAGYLEMLERRGFADAESHTKGISLERPTGTILYHDPNRGNASVAAKGITVRCWVGAKIGRGVTDEKGIYSCSEKFRVGPYYRLYFYRDNDWSIKHNTISLSVAKNIGLGYHNKRGYDKTFTSEGGKDDVPFCIVSTAAHDYFKWCDDNSILKPHSDLRIWVASFLGCSAPMMSKVYGPLTVYGNSNSGNIYGDGWSEFGKTILNTTATNQASVLSFFLGLRPDVTLTYSIGSTSLYRTTLHELAHTSHMRKAGSVYWAKNISYTLTQWVNGEDTYGSVDSYNSGYCGVGEMWGYYIGGMLATEEYGGWQYTGDDEWFRPQILRHIVNNTSLTPSYVFNCLTSDVNSHQALKNKLIANYGNQLQINSVFANWGF